MPPHLLLFLAFPDADKQMYDALGFGLGAVLLQQGARLDTIPSRWLQLSATMLSQNKSCWLLRIFRCYLVFDKQFTLIIGQTLSSKLSQSYLGVKPIGVGTCNTLNFNYLHRSGRHNITDPLSRNPNFEHLNAVLAVTTRSCTCQRYVQDLHSYSAFNSGAS